MKVVYEGKTKTVLFDEETGDRYLFFKDDATGADGVFDPGANNIGLTIEGMGKACLRMSDYFFRMLQGAGVKTHYVGADIENAAMTVQKAATIGRGLEIICRFRATGSFMRRYGLYAEEGRKLDALVEFTLKDDDRQDPLITMDALSELGILSEEEYEQIKLQTKRICALIKGDLERKGLELYDIKLEFGRVGNIGGIILIDEISAGNMRVYKDGKIVEPMELAKLVLG